MKKNISWILLAAAALLCIHIYVTDHVPDMDLLPSHREDFVPGIEPGLLAQLGGYDNTLQVYRLLDNAWYLSNELTEFSQAVTMEVFYVAPLDHVGQYSDRHYSYLLPQEDGSVRFSSAMVPQDAPTPRGFSGLNDGVIRAVLEGVDYQDYILTSTYADLNCVIVWVRCTQEDRFLVYASRPEFLKLEPGTLYTLDEVTAALAAFYHQTQDL